MSSKFDLAIITGGSSGIGCSIIEGLNNLDSDTQVFNLSRRNPSDFTHRKSFTHIACDLADRQGRKIAFDTLERSVRQASRTGRILLVNNAGFGLYGDVSQRTSSEHLELLEVNVAALVELTSRLLPILLERGGSIVNIASTAAFQPTPHLASYGASKSFVLHWTLALAEELRNTPVDALAVCPGPTRTEFFRRAGFTDHVVPGGFSHEPTKVVETLFNALENRRSLAIPGLTNKLLTSFSRLAPIRLCTRLSGRVISSFRR